MEEKKIERLIGQLESNLEQGILYYNDEQLSCYHYCKDKSSKPCEKCMELEEMDLPYDCIMNPDYCNRKSVYLKYQELFEELLNKQKIQNN